MEVTLRNFEKELKYELHEWWAIIHLARENGWSPKSSYPPCWLSDAPCVEQYYSSCCLDSNQCFCHKYSQEFAEALQKGLDALPEILKTVEVEFEDFENYYDEYQLYDPSERIPNFLALAFYFSTEGLIRLEELIRFCRNSGFVVEGRSCSSNFGYVIPRSVEKKIKNYGNKVPF